MHMNYSLFVLHLICHIRQNISLAVSLQQIPYKILYHYNAYELFTLRSSLNLWHIRQNIILAVSLRQFPTKFCITTRHLDFSLFTFRFSLTHV